MDKFDDLKAFLKKALPILKAVAATTPNKVDDAAVLFLEAWLASGISDPKAFAATQP